MTETTQEERLYWNTQLHRRGRGNLSGPDLQRLLNDADRLAQLEDGIRALADQLDTDPPDNTLIHDEVGTVADVATRLRALLGEE